MSYDDKNIDWDNWERDPNAEDGTIQEEEFVVKDANGNILQEWDAIIAIKDLKVKWAKDIKRWDKFKNIKFTDDPELVLSWKMYLRTEFFKKA